MKQNHLWDKHLAELKQKLEILSDKPEETAESTLKALWFKAAGDPKSTQAAFELEQPPLSDIQQAALCDLITQRLDGVPLAHLTERQQFMGIELLTGPEALIPRKETEILGHTAQKIVAELSKKQKKIILMDICTGAGNLIVSLAVKNPNVIGYASDLSEDAVSLAKHNVEFQDLEDRVEIRAGDLLTPFDTPDFHQKVDLLICNPPYISSGKVPEMADEISQYEPQLAFDGGPFGVKVLYSLMKEAPHFLRPGGWLAFEVGLGQGEAMAKRMSKTYTKVQNETDDNGAIRVVLGQI